MSPETKSQWPTFCRRQYGSVFIQFFVVGSERRIFSGTECVSAVEGHPSSLIWHQSKGRMRLPIGH